MIKSGLLKYIQYILWKTTYFLEEGNFSVSVMTVTSWTSKRNLCSKSIILITDSIVRYGECNILSSMTVDKHFILNKKMYSLRSASMVCSFPMTKTRTLLLLQCFLLVNRYGTNRVRPEVKVRTNHYTTI